MNSAVRDALLNDKPCENFKCDKSVIDEGYGLKAQVDDINIAYKVFGSGEPVILIIGFGGSMMNWDKTLIKELSIRNTTIIFDNRGVGHTTNGTKKSSIDQFAKDTAGLLDAIKVKKANVLGFSMGGMIAQELALSYPDKVNKIILYASCCGGDESIYTASPEVIEAFSNISSVTCNILLRLATLMFPKKWRIENPNFMHLFDNPYSVISTNTIHNQCKAIFSWRGVCDRLNQIMKPTLIITGMEDVLVPSINSSIIAQHITNSKTVQMSECGHGLMYQVPQTFSSIVSTFLES